jgi:hypothetical protein
VLQGYGHFYRVAGHAAAHYSVRHESHGSDGNWCLANELLIGAGGHELLARLGVAYNDELPWLSVGARGGQSRRVKYAVELLLLHRLVQVRADGITRLDYFVEIHDSLLKLCSCILIRDSPLYSYVMCYLGARWETCPSHSSIFVFCSTLVDNPILHPHAPHRSQVPHRRQRPLSDKAPSLARFHAQSSMKLYALSVY